MIVLNIIAISLYTLVIIKLLYYLTNIYQQNHYDYKKTLLSLKKYYLTKKTFFCYLISIPFGVIGINNTNLPLICMSIIILTISFIFQIKYILKLKFTSRMIRLWVTSILFITIIGIISIYINSIIYILIPLYLPIIVFLASLVNLPIEHIINNYYYKLAQQKLQSFDDLVKIGITGSFGKTSTKDILYQIISRKYLTLKTPKSYNTLMGISRTINSDLNKPMELFIVEMGTFRIGEISKLSKFVKPNIAIITQIGPQHLSTLKTEANVLKAKLEIVDGLKENGTLILNTDNEYLNNVKDHLSNTYNVLTYGIDRGTYHAKNITYKVDKTIFDIYKDDMFLFQASTSLLGKHQISNILASYVTTMALKEYNIIIDDLEFKKAIEAILPSEHRLSYQKINKLHIYDDSYSSNIIGFKNALDVLKRQKGYLCLITPGIVDAGEGEKELNETIAKELNNINEICLIKNHASTYIATYLNNNNINYLLFDNFKEAYKYIFKISLEKEVYLLIENDLPDSFLER
ncbi:MAG: UDP-N-acetylmuramoyl-tripeptide--D-alanyl-D-alanine ligase [Acholeplasmatales bacterium]|nr:UDP-N-acetylmuramoyl-tripeptide--D-alanyl-D-alanine ligase [Acholeplasmatales bacterium]